MNSSYKIAALTWVVLTVVVAVRPGMAWTQAAQTNANGVSLPLKWETSGFRYSIHGTGSDVADVAELKEVVRRSFDTWQNVPCSYLRFEETPPATTSDVAFYTQKGNVNLMVWRDTPTSWAGATNEVALMSIHFDDSDGTILDVDFEFNEAYWTFEIFETSLVGVSESIDLQSTITHEIGHALGLGHSEFPEATMADSIGGGDIEKRTLSEDDINGICALYPVADDPKVFSEPYCGLDLSGHGNQCDLPNGVNSDECSFLSVPQGTINLFGIFF